jgi:hypothetical protein
LAKRPGRCFGLLGDCFGDCFLHRCV